MRLLSDARKLKLTIKHYFRPMDDISIFEKAEQGMLISTPKPTTPVTQTVIQLPQCSTNQAPIHSSNIPPRKPSIVSYQGQPAGGLICATCNGDTSALFYGECFACKDIREKGTEWTQKLQMCDQLRNITTQKHEKITNIEFGDKQVLKVFIRSMINYGYTPDELTRYYRPVPRQESENKCAQCGTHRQAHENVLCGLCLSKKVLSSTIEPTYIEKWEAANKRWSAAEKVHANESSLFAQARSAYLTAVQMDNIYKQNSPPVGDNATNHAQPETVPVS